MPTGYTVEVAEGTITELAPFALQLARGMGALLSMRDEPWDAPIPDEFPPSQYHSDKLAAALAEKARILAMSDQECADAARAAVEEYRSSNERYEQGIVARRARYLAMIDKVKCWDGAPEGIKAFALEQLNEGMRFDCPIIVKNYDAPPAGDGPEWRSEQLIRILKDIAYHSSEQAKENERSATCTAWVRQLKESLAHDSAVIGDAG